METRYTLYKNGRAIIYGLAKRTYLNTFESMRRKSAEACTFVGNGRGYIFTLGNDVYKMEAIN